MLDQMVQRHREEMTENLAKLLMFTTVSGSSDPEERRASANEISRAFSFLNGLARRMEFNWRNYDNRVCVIEQPGGADGVIGLPLHVDVVPSGEGWRFPAFGGMVEDNVIYGRGAQDDKGPIIQMLYALYCLKRLQLPFRRTVRLIIASQEETGNWDDVEDYLQKEPAPDMCIVSDSEFPIVNGEKGMLDVKIQVHWESRGVEDAPLRFKRIFGGERPNIVPNRGEIVWEVTSGQAKGVSQSFKEYLLDYLKSHPGSDAFPLRMDRDPDSQVQRVHVTFLGKSAHGSKPDEGHNALLDTLLYYAGLPEQPAWVSKTARFFHDCFADLRGRFLGVAGSHPFIGETTVNLGMLEINDSSATAVVNIRPTLGVTTEDLVGRIRAKARAWADAEGLRVDVNAQGKAHNALFLDPAEHGEMIGALQTAFERVTGRKAELVAASGTTFAKAFPNALSFGPILRPDEPCLVHQADECVRVDDMLRNVKIYGYGLMLLATEI
jgi:succinyl-diaminopimelate desuccinylase